jgi:hypothetical protein
MEVGSIYTCCSHPLEVVWFLIVSKTDKLQQSRHLLPDQPSVPLTINININQPLTSINQHQHQHPLTSPIHPQQPYQPHQTQTTKMSSSNWEQHFLDKFLASSSRPATPTTSQPRNASPARWRPSSRYNSLQPQSPTGSDRIATTTTSAAR